MCKHQENSLHKMVCPVCRSSNIKQANPSDFNRIMSWFLFPFGRLWLSSSYRNKVVCNDCGKRSQRHSN